MDLYEIYIDPLHTTVEMITDYIQDGWERMAENLQLSATHFTKFHKLVFETSCLQNLITHKQPDRHE